MNRIKNIRTRQTERRKINTRAKVITLMFGLATSFLLYNVYDLQTEQHTKMQNVARGNAIKELNLSPERGDIYDRNGVLLAGTRSLYDLVVIPEKIANFRKDKTLAVSEFLEVIQNFVKLPDVQTKKISEKILKARSYEEVVIKEDISDADLSIILSNVSLIDGIGVQSKRVREYKYPDMYISPIGYVGRVSRDDLTRITDHKVLPTDYTGKMGIEKLYDKELYGKVGAEIVALNARGRVVERQIARPPEKGESLHLTIDHRLQSKAYDLMKGQSGAVVMSDVRTGELLVLLSAPFANANKFIKGLDGDDAKEIFSPKSGKPLYNRAIRGQYPPASTIKPFMGLAGVDGGFIDPSEEVWSGPYYELGGLKFRDWKRWGHGKVDLSKAIAVSSDVYFYKLAKSMGVDYIHDYLYELGFGQKTGIELEHEATGLLPSSQWKRSVKKEPWYEGESLNVGIGQGYFMATPIQLNTALSTILNSGVRYRPQLIADQPKEIMNTVEISKESLDPVLQGMSDVVNAKYGTARSVRDGISMTVAGKTGTGQVYSTNGQTITDNADLEKKLRDHALFLAFAPVESPEISITVFIENGSSGSKAAAPIANELIKEYEKIKQEKSNGI